MKINKLRLHRITDDQAAAILKEENDLLELLFEPIAKLLSEKAIAGTRQETEHGLRMHLRHAIFFTFANTIFTRIPKKVFPTVVDLMKAMVLDSTLSDASSYPTNLFSTGYSPGNSHGPN